MSAPVSAYVGYNGGGKTLAAMVFEVGPAIREGTPIYSTVEINHPSYVPIRSWVDIVPVRNALIFFDDISAQFPSRGAMGLPAQLLVKINTLRHDNVRVVWTGPSWKRADIALREVTQEVTDCRGFLSDAYVRKAWDPGEGPGWSLSGVRQPGIHGWKYLRSNPLWRPNRLFRFKTWDATKFTEFTEGAVKGVRPKRKIWYYRPWQPEQFLYDTLAPVSLLDHVDQAGSCVACGGKRTARKCSCADGGHGVIVGAPELASPPTSVPDLMRELIGGV